MRFKIILSLIVMIGYSLNIFAQSRRASSNSSTADVGNSQIMVIPHAQSGDELMQTLRNCHQSIYSASEIESQLTNQFFEVLIPQQDKYTAINNAVMALGDSIDSETFNIALTIGSDVYMTFYGFYDQTNNNDLQYVSIIRAFETTTRRLLGSATGRSRERSSESTLCIQEAINEAMPQVISRITRYWEMDVSSGIQYKLVININPSFNERQTLEIQNTFMAAVGSIANRYAEETATSQNMSYRIWSCPITYDSSRKVFLALEDYFNQSDLDVTLNLPFIERKMMMIRIDR